MEAVFLKLVNMSIAASYLVLAVAAVRLMFRKIPKWLLCLLWGLVALRLLCPLRLQSALSLIPSAQTLPEEILYTARPEIQSGIAPVDAVVNGALETSMPPADPTASANPTQIWSFLLSRVWLAGVGVLLLYAVGSVLLLRRRVATAIPVGKNIKRSEFVDTPFVLGLLHPVIYLPACLAEEDIPFVIAHEETHIRRGDPWWKLLGFGLLCVYWFNPVMWLAYVLLCRDIEGACDERVIRDMPLDARRAYSLALFHCSIRRPRATAPLAFGEVGVKERVKNVMNYKKPAFWAVAVAAILGIVLSVCFLTDPIRVSEVTGISLRGRRLVSLTDAQTDTMLSILRELEGTPEQIPQTDGFDVITIDIQSPQGSRLVNTLPDCACVWEEGGHSCLSGDESRAAAKLPGAADPGGGESANPRRTLCRSRRALGVDEEGHLRGSQNSEGRGVAGGLLFQSRHLPGHPGKASDPSESTAPGGIYGERRCRRGQGLLLYAPGRGQQPGCGAPLRRGQHGTDVRCQGLGHTGRGSGGISGGFLRPFRGNPIHRGRPLGLADTAGVWIRGLFHASAAGGGLGV